MWAYTLLSGAGEGVAKVAGVGRADAGEASAEALLAVVEVAGRFAGGQVIRPRDGVGRLALGPAPASAASSSRFGR